MTLAKLLKRTVLVGPILGAMVGGAVLIGCATDSDDRGVTQSAVASQETTERAEDSSRGEHSSNSEQSRESGGEHGSQAGSNGEGGQHNEASERGGEAISASSLARDAAFDEVRNGARLVLKFDDASNSFRGSVENVSDRVLTRVRVEIHLDNGTELGPTTPTDLAPGETLDIVLPSTSESFTVWTTHAEFGASEGGGESREAEMSSPITPLDETWTGVLGGMAVEASFDQATGTAHTAVRNATGETLCFVQSEPHLKSGTRTVGELGPDVIGDLAPGQQVSTSISVDSEPSLAGVSFDGYVVHLEVFECGGPGPQPHSGEGSEGGESNEGSESSGESDGEHGNGDHE